MATIATIDMLLRAQTAQFSRDMKRSTGELRGLKAQAASTAATLKGMAAGYLSFQLVKSQITSTFREMEEDAKATRKLDAALTATGNSAGFGADQLQKMASDFQALSNFEDDAIANSEALLLTFRNIKGDNFKSTMQAALDLSTALDKDLNSSVMQLGKALNDPVKGMTQLRKVGILFSEQQKQQVKDFMAVGNAAAAQKVILDELEKSYGGQALSATNSLTGQTQDLKEAWDELKKSVIEPLTPGITAGIKELTALLKDAKQFQDTNDAGSANRIQKTALDLMGLNAILPDWTSNAGLPGVRRNAGAGASAAASVGSGAQAAAREMAIAAAAMEERRNAFAKRLGQGRDPLDVQGMGRAGTFINGLAEAARAAKTRLDSMADTLQAQRRVWEETRTPGELLGMQIAELQRTFPKGGDTYLRALKKARADFIGSLPDRGQLPSAFERGSVEAFTAQHAKTSEEDVLKGIDAKSKLQLDKTDRLILAAEEQVRQTRDRPIKLVNF